MRKLLIFFVVLIGLLVGAISLANLGLPSPVVITKEGQQKLILLFGEVRTTTTPGLSFMIPFVEEARTYPARWLHSRTEAVEIQTKDGEQLLVDNYTVWRIVDAEQFQASFPAGREAAEQRIDREVRGAVRDVIGKHTLAQVLKDQRMAIMEEITSVSTGELADEGVRIVDVRINRTELPKSTEDSVFARMKTERERLARKNRAEGDERARRIRAEADREARVIVANARRDAEIARGEGDAESTRIYAESYGEDPEFYSFLRSLEAYRKSIDSRTTLVLSPDTEFFQYLQDPEGPKPAPRRRR
ncbi:MAG: protease modulator HflC [Myxococcota bacterium]